MAKKTGQDYLNEHEPLGEQPSHDPKTMTVEQLIHFVHGQVGNGGEGHLVMIDHDTNEIIATVVVAIGDQTSKDMLEFVEFLGEKRKAIKTQSSLSETTFSDLSDGKITNILEGFYKKMGDIGK